MKIQKYKKTRMISALAAFGLCLSLVSIANSSAGTFDGERVIETSDRLQEAKPIAGRNRRRGKSAVSLSRYPQANADQIRISRRTNKLRINVLSNDNGHKLRVVDINSRSAGGARISVRNGMVVYKTPQDFVGKDSFWYTMQDTAGRQHSAKVIVCVCDK